MSRPLSKNNRFIKCNCSFNFLSLFSLQILIQTLNLCQEVESFFSIIKTEIVRGLLWLQIYLFLKNFEIINNFMRFSLKKAIWILGTKKKKHLKDKRFNASWSIKCLSLWKEQFPVVTTLLRFFDVLYVILLKMKFLWVFLRVHNDDKISWNLERIWFMTFIVVRYL